MQKNKVKVKVTVKVTLIFFLCVFITMASVMTTFANDEQLDSSSNSVDATILEGEGFTHTTPAESLSKCTNDLVEDMLKYEYLSDFSEFDFQHYLSRSAALQELQRREDSATVLLHNYLNSHNEVTKLYIENLLKQDVFYQRLTMDELNAFNSARSNSVSVRLAQPIIYYDTGDNVFSYCGNTIPTLRALSDFSNEQKLAYREYMESTFDSIVYVGEATRNYNCHSYAWYSPNTSNNKWINYIDGYLSDAHVTQVESYQMTAGTIIVYLDENNNPLHSAIVVEPNTVNLENTVCISKWGNQCLVTHDVTDVPNEYKLSSGNVSLKYYRIYSRENHLMTQWYSYNSSNYHKRTCVYCPLEELQLHTYGSWTSVNGINHQRTCSVCNYIHTGKHKDSYDSIGGYCRLCGYSGMILLGTAPITTVNKVYNIQLN